MSVYWHEPSFLPYQILITRGGLEQMGGHRYKIIFGTAYLRFRNHRVRSPLGNFLKVQNLFENYSRIHSLIDLSLYHRNIRP